MRAAQNDVEATWRKVGELLDVFSKEECANHLKNSGYVSYNNITRLGFHLHFAEKLYYASANAKPACDLFAVVRRLSITHNFDHSG
ncbi:hypothetical protein QA640_39090 [Bradyrhizobium sp. CB82]|uniref:hypothetical protein n=1 Tax=Bradyrhizobium sp. CB82 TaxID=3039159 RepID=UPI0024B06FC3|nr:hypothetical protein [Bradyrhizobium sp. CB82]WFU40156.1 hypothetical protein QA640_39090 [Bradyrhizobium sp. CB82]